METAIRQTWAFLFRGYHITRRYIGWVVVFNFYALVTSATVALIGVAANDYQMTLTLVVGALLWNYLSWLYQEIAMSIRSEERRVGKECSCRSSQVAVRETLADIRTTVTC